MSHSSSIASDENAIFLLIHQFLICYAVLSTNRCLTFTARFKVQKASFILSSFWRQALFFAGSLVGSGLLGAYR